MERPLVGGVHGTKAQHSRQRCNAASASMTRWCMPRLGPVPTGSKESGFVSNRGTRPMQNNSPKSRSRCCCFGAPPSTRDGDFAAFLTLLRQAGERTAVPLLACCLMPNHFHLALWPQADGELSDYLRWLLTAHVRRSHQHYHS